jgi:hypothetical protein
VWGKKGQKIKGEGINRTCSDNSWSCHDELQRYGLGTACSVAWSLVRRGSRRSNTADQQQCGAPQPLGTAGLGSGNGLRWTKMRIVEK